MAIICSKILAKYGYNPFFQVQSFNQPFYIYGYTSKIQIQKFGHFFLHFTSGKLKVQSSKIISFFVFFILISLFDEISPIPKKKKKLSPHQHATTISFCIQMCAYFVQHNAPRLGYCQNIRPTMRWQPSLAPHFWMSLTHWVKGVTQHMA